VNETEIRWTELTWNAVSGCTKVSPGCKFCYAETLAENKRGTRAFPVGFDILLRPWKLDEPRKVKRPSLIFTNSMSDFFHADIPDEYRDRMCDAMEGAPQHRYQVLTKRPDIAARYAKRRRLPRSVWIGTTIDNDATTYRADLIRDIDATVRFISAEPLLSAVPSLKLDGIHWLIGGGESGSHLSRDDATGAKNLEERALVRRGDRRAGEALWVPREDRAHWMRDLRDACVAAGTAFFFKQHGGPRPTSGGHLLDGRAWEEMPTTIPGAMPSEDYAHRSALSSRPAQRSLPLL
jgi:protein gp37